MGERLSVVSERGLTWPLPPAVDRRGALPRDGTPTEPPSRAPPLASPEGYVDIYGYHASAGGLFFCGWVTYPWPTGKRPTQFVAMAGNSRIGESALTTFYHRDDIRGRGIAFVTFVECGLPAGIASLSLEVCFGEFSYRIAPTESSDLQDEAELVEGLRGVLASGEEESQRRQMQELLLGAAVGLPEPPSQLLQGFVDFYGYHSVATGWLFCGWLSGSWRDEVTPQGVLVSFQEGDITGKALVASYPRSDLADGRGIVFCVEAPGARLGALCSITFSVGDCQAILDVGPAVQRFREPELQGQLRGILAGASLTESRDRLLALVNRQPFAGVDTLARHAEQVLFEVDETILCEPDGLALIGWFLAKPGAVREVRVCAGGVSHALRLDDCIRIDRPDVMSSIGVECGFYDDRCGFIAFVPLPVTPGARLHAEVETPQGELAFKLLPAAKLGGIAAIRRLLECFDAQFVEMAPAFDRVIGPAVERLNRQRLAARPAASVVDFGPVPQAPRFSVIVPLYGRLDFVEYQLGLFSTHAPAGAAEFIYVLDDPPRRREAQLLFASLYERFRIPFRALLLDRNVGFAPANNIGLEHATGDFVAFVNSDVFPGTPDWLERLAARLRKDPSLGTIGPLLLFEDGSVQHQGMYFKRLDEFGGWHFGQHFGKGMRHAGSTELQRPVSITGACMLMKRSVALQLSGFDEAYVIGDFEDSDLCFKLQRAGLGCAVDPQVRLYHLERKSQASSAQTWRMNLTLYNAWVHERRWADMLSSSGVDALALSS